MFLPLFVDRMHQSIFRNEEALDYLHSRRVTDDEIKEFKLGYSKVVSIRNDGSEDYDNFMRESYGGRLYERKIIFPLYDMLGNTIGVLGRAIDSKAFKFYLTKEGKFFGAFFGFHQALPKIYETGRVFTVEGPFDFLAFRKVYPNVVATMTAELTDDQYDLLNFFAEEIVTAFDSDGPGRRASERAKEKWPKLKTLSLGFKDPDGALKYWDDPRKFESYVRGIVGRTFWL